MAAPSPIAITCSRHFLSWLAQASISLAVTTYQTNRLFLFGRHADGTLSRYEQHFDRPMGLFATPDTLVMATRYQIWTLVNRLSPGQQYEGFDRLYVPHQATTTGALDVHDIALDAQGQVVFVNTLFSCLSTLSEQASFRPLWHPPFISALVPEERCHLNGLAMCEGQPAFVTAVSRSDEPAGWRQGRTRDGVVVDVTSGAIVCEGLSMPHSPRWYRNQLWLLNSGTGELGTVDLDTGQFVPVAFVPGYGRGLAFHGSYAVVGLSKPRHNRMFRGLPLDAQLQQHSTPPRCGVYIIDLNTGQVAHWLRFEGVVNELYEVQVLPDVQQPMALGFKTDEIHRHITSEQEGDIATHILRPPKGGRSTPSPPRVATPGDAIASPWTLHIGTSTLAEAHTHYRDLLFSHHANNPLSHPEAPVIGVVARYNGRAAGLLLAEAQTGQVARLLSLFVRRPYRNQGIGTALLERLENVLQTQGFTTVEGHYRTSWAGHTTLERILRHQGWASPKTQQHLIKVEIARLCEADWVQHAVLPPAYTVFPWTTLTDTERTALQENPFFPPALTPFQMADQLEPDTSLGLRHAGAVVGWVITHRLKKDLIQYTSLFAREGIPKGRILALLAQAIRQQSFLNVPYAACMIDAENTAMQHFAQRRLASAQVAHAEVRTVGKRLGPQR